MEEQNNPIEVPNEPVMNEALPEKQKSGPNIPLIIAAVVLFIAGLIFLLNWLGPKVTGEIRDTSLVVYVLSAVVTVTALVVVILQTIKLINFLKNEIEPIVKPTTKAVKQASGTISFLSENAVGPAKNAVTTLSGIKNTGEAILALFKK